MTLCPQRPAAVSFHLSAPPGAAGASARGGVPPACDQRAGRARGRKPSSLVWLSRRGRGSRRFHVAGRAVLWLLAAREGGCRGAGPELERVTAWGRCEARGPSCPFWPLGREREFLGKVGLQTGVWKEVGVPLAGTGAPRARPVCLQCWCCPEPRRPPALTCVGSRGQP